MKTPRFAKRDKDVSFSSAKIEGHQGGEFELLVFRPKGLGENAPCLIDFHGGGFVYEAWHAHYRHALEYAKRAKCVVIFPRYRLAPKYFFPYPQEDCYLALRWVLGHKDELGIDEKHIGLIGDSAGGMLAMAVTLMAHDRSLDFHPCCLALLYPFLDASGQSESAKQYTDVPMWNAKSSKKLGKIVHHDFAATPLPYRSPLDASDFSFMPPTYIEVAEYDALHDDGIHYAEILENLGIEHELHQPIGTMHAFDTKVNAPTTKRMVEYRISFLKAHFEK